MEADRRARAQELLHSLGLDALIVGHPPNIRYLTGLNASAGLLVLGVRECVLIVDFRYAATARSLADGTACLAVEIGEGPLDATVPRVLGRLATGRVGVEAEHLTLGRFDRLSSMLNVSGRQTLAADERTPALVRTERFVERMRAVKDATEIETMREAARRISAVARKARAWVRPGLTERAIAAAVDAAMREAGFERPAFETIVASGPNSALPHARPTSRVVGDHDGVLLDFGGVYDGYCVDLTRTLHIGPMPAQFRRLFDAVREAQAAAIAAVKPGVSGADIDREARQVLERHGLGEAFGHGTGHGLGLEVHEEPRISPSAAPDEQVLAGMVFTVEPGAYVPGVGGVRIEDDVLVTGDGCELLTDVPIDF